MAEVHCPVCESALSEIAVAPCWDCGHSARELSELDAGGHEYNVFRAFGSHEIVLCDFCDADFGSYFRGYFGLPEPQKTLDPESLELIGPLPKPWVIAKDAYCPSCKHRLAFLKFRCAVAAQYRTDAGTQEAESHQGGG